MPLIVAIEPDRQQAAKLAALARGPLHAELILADSTERAFATLANRVPDLILTSLLLSPKDEAALADRLRDPDLSGARVQTLVIPVLSSAPRRSSVRTGLLNKLRRSTRRDSAPDGCDPAVFAAQIAEYLKEAAAERARLEELGASRQADEAAAMVRIDPTAQPAPIPEGWDHADSAPESVFTDPSDQSVREPDTRLIPLGLYTTSESRDAEVQSEAGQQGFFDHAAVGEEPTQAFENSALPVAVPTHDEIITPHEEIVAAREEIIRPREEIVAQRDEIIKPRDEVVVPRDEIIATNDELLAQPDAIIAAAREDAPAAPHDAITPEHAPDDAITLEPIDLEAFVRELEAATRPASDRLEPAPEKEPVSSAAEPPSGIDREPLSAAGLDEDIAAFLDALPKLNGPAERRDSDSSSAPAVRLPGPASRGPTGARRRKKKATAPSLPDDWSFFDPERCGFAALLAKLDELVEAETGKAE